MNIYPRAIRYLADITGNHTTNPMTSYTITIAYAFNHVTNGPEDLRLLFTHSLCFGRTSHIGFLQVSKGKKFAFLLVSFTYDRWNPT